MRFILDKEVHTGLDMRVDGERSFRFDQLQG